MLDDKIAIVTGAGQGLGRGIVCEMARQHAAGIAVVDRNRQSAEETAAVAKELGSEVLVIECDLRDRDQIESMVELGGRRTSAVWTCSSTTPASSRRR